MPTVKLSNPLSAAYAERLGLAVRAYAIGESVVVDTTLAQYLEFVGYGVVTDAPSPGAPLLFGTGVPAAGLGVNGSYYLDTAAQRVYGPKTSGGWGSGTALAGSTVLLGGMVVAPKGDQGDPGPPGTPGSAASLAIRAASDYDNGTAPSTGQVVRWNGSKFAPASLAASDVGAVSVTGAETVAGVKTFSSAPVVAAGTGAGNPIRYDDASRTNARTPLAHATSHATGASDAVSPAAIGAATSGHTHTAGSVGAAPASHQHDGSAITGGVLGLIDAINLEAQGGTPTAPASGATLWTPGTLAVNALGSDGVQRRLKPIRSVTSWPPDAESAIGDEAVVESTGEHRVYMGTTLGWRQVEPAVLTAAARGQLATSGLHAGWRVWETDTLREWVWSGSVWVLVGGRKPFVQAAKYGGQGQSLPANSATIVLWPTLIGQTDGGATGMWRGASVGGLYAPIDGFYELHTNMHLANDGAANVRWEVKARVSGVGTSQHMIFAAQRLGVDYWSIGGMTPLPMTAGQYVEVIAINNGAAATIGGYSGERYITGVTLRWVNPLV